MRAVLTPLLWLALAALAVLAPLLSTMYADEQAERIAMAGVGIETLAQAIERAAQAGLRLENGAATLDRLARLHLPPEIVSVRLLGMDQRPLWHYGAAPAAPLTVLHYTVGPLALLSADFAAPAGAGNAGRAGLILLAATAALALPLTMLAALIARREQLAARCFARQCDAVRAGRYRTLWLADGDDDPRMAYLREQITLLAERCQQAQRLLASLERGEPDPSARTRLAALQAGLAHRHRFPASGGPLRRRLWPAPEAARCGATLVLMLATLPLGAFLLAPWPALAWTAWAGGWLFAVLWRRLAWDGGARLIAACVCAAAGQLLTPLAPGWPLLPAQFSLGAAAALAAATALATWRGGGRRCGLAWPPLLG
ncbi:hypothetical protein, partial [Rugamonas aquatica]